MITQDKWKWFGTAGHLTVSAWCRFHLCTEVGKYMVSTVGEHWPERDVREIHASITDPKWHEENNYLRGDRYDAAYMERFGYKEIGLDAKYETYVFEIGAHCDAKGCACGLPRPKDWMGIDGQRSNSAKDATHVHYEFCHKYAKME